MRQLPLGVFVISMAAFQICLLRSGHSESNDPKSISICVQQGQRTLADDQGFCPPGTRKLDFARVTDGPKRAPSAPTPAISKPSKPIGPATDGLKGWLASNTGPCHVGLNTRLHIGDSFNDVNFLSLDDCGALTSQAKGAQFSWARDGIARNNIWTAKGAIALTFVDYIRPLDKPTGPFLELFSVAPVFAFQRVINTNANLTKQDINNLSYGFSSEALFDYVGQAQLYLRARATANGDFEGQTHSWSTTVEAQPVWSQIEKFHLGFADVTLLPLVRGQYFDEVGSRNSTTYKPDAIFARSRNVVRVGPVLTASLAPAPTQDAAPDKPIPPPPYAINFTASYYYDFVNALSYRFINPSVTYNFTDNVGLTASYENGQIEQTGKRIDLINVGLSVKY